MRIKIDPMHRPTVGLIALALLAAATASHVWGFGGEALEGVCLRVGLVMAMLWLALPQARQLKSKLVIGGLIALFGIVAFRPRLLPVLLKVAPVFIAVLFVLSLFRRKKAEGDKGRQISDRERALRDSRQETGDRRSSIPSASPRPPTSNH